MSEPKFHVGQDVAACTSDCRVIIPMTVVTSISWDAEEYCLNPASGEAQLAPEGWYYGVAACDYPFLERCLRPINPDTEYLETHSDQEQPV